MSAMAQNLLTYNREGFRDVADIINRWAPPSENQTGAYVTDVAKRMGVSSTQQLNLRDPQVLQSLMTAMIHHEQGYDPYSAQLISSAIESRLGTGGGVTISQKTEINVNGAADPASVARQVYRSQEQVNNDLVRNTQGAIR
jgi:hypothetical protein